MIILSLCLCVTSSFWVYFAVSGRFNNCVEHKIYVGLNTSWFFFGVDIAHSGNNTKKKIGERKSEVRRRCEKKRPKQKKERKK